MQINPFVVPLPADIKRKEQGASPGFKDLCKRSDKVNRQQLQAQEATRQFISGDLRIFTS